MSSDLHPHYAYPDEVDVESVMRFGSVKRWHMLDTVRVQTLAEHSGNVALLVYLVAKTAPGMFFGPAAPAAGLAIIHDVSEVFTGDIPTPTKKAIFGSWLDELERRVTPPVFFERVQPEVRKLIKLCDLAEGIRFIRLFGGRTTVARHAQTGLGGQFFSLIRVPGWPDEISQHVLNKVWFYANETGIELAWVARDANEGPVGPDMARGSGSIPGGAGRELRDEGSGPRNGVAGTEGHGGGAEPGAQIPDRTKPASMDRDSLAEDSSSLPD